ncbi:MAG: hypothetical protein AABX74_01835 [Nanoarchaeota archaeon]|mgnify:CR=1 FL=1
MLYSINDPEFIAMVKKGVPIETLEKRMRPPLGLDGIGAEASAHDDWWNYSSVGFLGRDESLLNVIHEDEEAVARLGVTHDQIADRIEYFIIQYGVEFSKIMRDIGIMPLKERIAAHKAFNRYIVVDPFHLASDNSDNITGGRGIQECPWLDGVGDYGDKNLRFDNLRLGETLSFPGLIVHLIREHHFYEGKQSPYRVDPTSAMRVLEIKN